MAEYFTSKVSTVSNEKPSKYKQLKTVEASPQDDHVLRDSYPLSTPGSQGFPLRGSSPRTLHEQRQRTPKTSSRSRKARSLASPRRGQGRVEENWKLRTRARPWIQADTLLTINTARGPGREGKWHSPSLKGKLADWTQNCLWPAQCYEPHK